MTTLLELFATACAAGIASPTVRTEKYKFKWSVNRNRIYVTDHGPFDDHEYFGAIHPDGRFWPQFRGHNPVIADEIIGIIKDVGPSMKVYGQKTGSCCMCGRLLVNKTSIKYSIGPICASKVGMPLSYFEEYDTPSNPADGISLDDV